MTLSFRRCFKGRHLVGIVFVAAGLSKWFLVPADHTVYGSIASVWSGFALLWPAIEVLLGVILLTGFYWPVMRSIALLLLSAFVGILVLELFSPTPRSCGCLGTAILPAVSPQLQIGFSLAVDVGLILLLATTGTPGRRTEVPPPMASALTPETTRPETA